MTGGVAWVNGRLVPRGDAVLPIDDFAFRYGAACFETMLARHGRVFRLDRHLERLAGGLRTLGVRPPPTEALGGAVAEALQANGLPDVVVRLTVTAGEGDAPSLGAASWPSAVVTVDPLAPGHGAPVSLGVVSVRIDEDRPLREAKTAQFVPYLLARAEARRAGAEDGLLLNRRGDVCEAATANVFAVFDGTLVTPPLEDGPLPGVTREAVLECATALGVPAEERTLSPAALAGAQEVFLTSSLGLRPVRCIEGLADNLEWSAEAPGTLTRRVTEAYEALVDRECASG